MPEHDEPDELDDTSRSDKKRARRVREDALARLAKELSELGDKRLERLELPEPVLEALDEVRRIRSLAARARQLRVVRAALRAADWPAIRARVDGLLEHGTVGTAVDAKVREWVVRLVGEGTKAMDELLAAHPKADRTHLRQLVRSAASGSEDRRRRAEQKLVQALRSLML